MPAGCRRPGVQMLVGLDNGEWTYWDQFDRYPQGGPRGNVYNFQHWQYVDTIYYYVHTVAAVPPVVWIHTAHRNGVKIVAAVTGDCDDGCDTEFNKLFEQPDCAAAQLHALASTFGFDGWLFDVEREAKADDNLARAMSLVGSKPLPDGRFPLSGYYEAFIYELNDHTYKFFHAGNAYQSDYSKSPGYPKSLYDYLAGKQQQALRFATYWAMNTYAYRSPTGRLSNGKDWLDVDSLFAVLRQAQMKPTPAPDDYYQSVGLYAPDWTIYGGSEHVTDPLPDRDTFHKTDRIFWVGEAPRLTPQRTVATEVSTVARYLEPRTSVLAKPFVTHFNTGEGSVFVVDGQAVATRDWNHLGCQDRLPTWLLPMGPSEGMTADYTYADAYDGGSALAFSGTVPPRSSITYGLDPTNIPLQGQTFITTRFLLKDRNSLLPAVRFVLDDGTIVPVPVTRGSGWIIATQRILPNPRIIVAIDVAFENSGTAAAPVNVVLGELIVHDPSTRPTAGHPDGDGGGDDVDVDTTDRVLDSLVLQHFLQGVERSALRGTRVSADLRPVEAAVPLRREHVHHPTRHHRGRTCRIAAAVAGRSLRALG